MSLKNQFRSIIEWEKPQPWELFRRWNHSTDELKNASKIILLPGQGCIFTYEGKIEGVFNEAGLYDIKTANKPFITTLKKFMNFFESEHKAGIWFYRAAEINNVRWGTRMPIKYMDPVYNFPVHLMGYGNFSLKINTPKAFFTNIVAGDERYYATDLQELILSRIAQPIGDYLANAKFSYADVDSHLNEIAREAKEHSQEVFENLGFGLLDFRIEGTSFDKETQKRIGEISDVSADAQAAKIAGVDFAELQRLKAMRDAAKNEGNAGSRAGFGLMAGMEMGKSQSKPQSASTDSGNIGEKLKTLKNLFDDGLIDEGEYKEKKSKLLEKL